MMDYWDLFTYWTEGIDDGMLKLVHVLERRDCGWTSETGPCAG